MNSAGGVTIDMNSEDTTLVIDANTDNETITVTDLGAKHGSTDTAALTAKGLADTQTLDVVRDRRAGGEVRAGSGKRRRRGHSDG